MGKIAIWVQRVLLRCFNQAKDYVAALSSIGCIGKEEVLPLRNSLAQLPLLVGSYL